MLFDTHCHLNFKTFDGRVGDVIKRAKNAGVGHIIVPGTDLGTSNKAVEIAEKHKGVYAAIGIHPHHVFELYSKAKETNFFHFRGWGPAVIKNSVAELSELLSHPKVVAIGEVGIDRHMYKKTKYGDYRVEKEFVDTQKRFLEEQIGLAVKYKKSLILHNREAKKEFVELLSNIWNNCLEYKTVFHCCEPDFELLEFARAHKVFIGVDGDIAYTPEKQKFIKKVPLDMLVLETDSPFLSPFRKFPNEPKNISHIAQLVSEITGKNMDEVGSQTTENARKLFKIE